ncbi:cytochrome P450 [Choanephora cucurbitarum]|nr:cytochrome P450 [Choanephora cucurbitarum]
MGTVLSYCIPIALTFLITKVAERFLWVNKRADGTQKEAWPPSPSGLPSFTNAYKLFEKETYHQLTRWHEELGDFYSVLIGQKRILVANTAELVQTLLVEKEQYNSSRLQSDTLERLLTDQCKTVFTAEFSLYWSRLRRAIFGAIGKATEASSRYIQAQTNKLIYGIGEQGNRLTANALRQVVNMLAMDTALALVYGEQHGQDTAAMATLMQQLESLEARQTRKYNRMAQFFSFINAWLDIVSLFSLNSQTLTPRNKILETVLPSFVSVYALRDPTVLPQDKLPLAGSNEQLNSIVKSLLQVEPSKNDPEVTQLSKDEILGNSVHLMLHAYVYLASTLFTLIQRLATEPAFQERLWQEHDKEVLATAFVRESMRLDPPNHLLGYGARTDYELDVKGRLYRVDADSEIVVNVDAIHQNERYYPHPHQFNPDRFLKSEKKTVSLMTPDATGKKTARDHLAFGAGRRVCLGSRVSEAFLVSSLLRLNQAYRLEGGDVLEKTESTTSIWHWTGRTETKGASIEFIKRS